MEERKSKGRENVMDIQIHFKDGEKTRFKRYVAENGLKIGGYVRCLIMAALDTAPQAQSGAGA